MHPDLELGHADGFSHCIRTVEGRGLVRLSKGRKPVAADGVPAAP